MTVSESFEIDQLIKKESDLLTYREALFEERRNHIKQACERLNVGPESAKPISRLLVAEKHKIAYCGIPKTGSTFWRKTLNIIENKAKFSSLFEYRNSDTKMPASLKHPEELSVGNNVSAFRSFMDETISFMFVREPYGRVFSAYNNKILNPNLLFWRSVGRRVIQTIRKQPSNESLQFGHDVTFPEMIKYLVTRFEEGQQADQHFASMSRTCDPCKMHFDYIGKMESFSDDMHFIIAKLRQRFRDVYVDFGDFNTETALDTAQGHVRFLFSALRATEGIRYPVYNFFLRTWRDLQIRGHLSKHIDMPLTRDQASNITSDEFFSLIKVALGKPMNKTEVKMQRREALKQAYSMIPLKDMERLRKYVEHDCLLFGYDTRPELLFNRDDQSDEGSFNYFDAI